MITIGSARIGNLSKRPALLGVLIWCMVRVLFLSPERLIAGGSMLESPFNPLQVQITVVDNFYSNPLAVRKLALAQEFAADIRYHKGKRTHFRYVPPGLKEIFEQLLCVKITHWDDPLNGIFQYCTAEDPIVYHSDKQSYAAAIYLTPDAPLTTGLNLLRSKHSGLRSAPVNADAIRTGKSLEELEYITYKNKLYDSTAWDVVDTVGNVFNRLAVWNAKLLHAAGGYFGYSAETSRLFQLFFFDAIPLWQLSPAVADSLIPPPPPSLGECSCPQKTNQCRCDPVLHDFV